MGCDVLLVVSSFEGLVACIRTLSSTRSSSRDSCCCLISAILYVLSGDDVAGFSTATTTAVGSVKSRISRSGRISTAGGTGHGASCAATVSGMARFKCSRVMSSGGDGSADIELSITDRRCSDGSSKEAPAH